MSFAQETEKLVNELMQAEYKNACENWGGTYNSLHEGYALLLEEIEEAETEMKKIKRDLEFLWLYLKRNDIEMINLNLSRIQESDLSCMKELAQVGAVLLKINNTLNYRKVVKECQKNN